MSLERMHEALPHAPLRDVSYAMDCAFKMRQVLKGEPTVILDVNDRRSLNELLPALMKEAQRRGVTLERECVPMSSVLHKPVP